MPIEKPKKKKKEPTPVEVERRKAGQEYIGEREKLASQQNIKSQEAARILRQREELATAPAREKEEAQLEEQKRREGFQEATGSKALQQQLQQQTEQPLSLKPEALITPNEFMETREFQPLGITGLSASKKLLEDPEKELKRRGVELAVGAAVGGLSLGLLSSIATKAGITKAVASSSGIVKGAALGIIATAVGGRLNDLKGGEVSNLRAEITKMTGSSSTILSAVQNGGLTPEEGLLQLRQLADAVDESEAAIKTAGIYSLRFRFDKEYIPAMAEIKDTRLNIIERIGGVETVAARGRPQLEPEQLLFDNEQMKGG